MPNQGLDTKDRYQDDSFDLDLTILQTLKNLSALINKRAYADLPYNQKIEVNKLNKTLSELYWQGFENASRDQDYEKAVKYFIKALELGWSKAIALYCKKTVENFEEEPEAQSKPKHADNKSNYELALLGVRYTLGLGVPQDDKLALYCYKKAAEHNNILGLLCYGMAFELGKGIKKNEDKALELYIKALNKIQNSKSTRIRQKKLPLIFESYLVKNHYPLVLYTAHKGNARAQYYMGIYKCNWDTLIDKERASWLLLAAEQGCEKAFGLVATYYLQASDEPFNLTQIIHWYRLSARADIVYDNTIFFNLPWNLALYFIAIQNRSAIEIANLLLKNPQLQTEFLNHDLEYILQIQAGTSLLSAIINSLLTANKASNSFLTSVFITLGKNTAPPSKELASLLRTIGAAIHFAETDPSQIADLLRCIVALENNHSEVFADLKPLHILWYRAQGLRCELDISIYKPVASLLLRFVCREEFTFNHHCIEPFHISLLCAHKKNKNTLSVEDINALLQTDLLKASETPGKKQHLFFTLSKNGSALSKTDNSPTVTVGTSSKFLELGCLFKAPKTKDGFQEPQGCNVHI